jgi:PhnB protein
MKIGHSTVMLGEPPHGFKPMPASNYLYVDDADAVFNKAIAAGATVVIPIADQFYGDRMGGVRDPQGNLWWIATRKQKLSSAEVIARMGSQGK